MVFEAAVETSVRTGFSNIWTLSVGVLTRSIGAALKASIFAVREMKGASEAPKAPLQHKQKWEMVRGCPT